MRAPSLSTVLFCIYLMAISSGTVQAGTAIEYEYNFDLILFEKPSSRDAYLSDFSARSFMDRKDSLEKSSQKTEDDDAPSVYDAQSPAINYRETTTGELDDALRTLERSSHYHVLSRKSWSQSGFKDGDSFRVDIDTADENQALDVVNLLPTDQNNAQTNAYLSGSVTFTFSRYIHLSTDLILDHTSLNDAPIKLTSAENADRSHIVLERKLRSGETHYVDHPLLGILINIERIKKAVGEN